MKKIKKVRTQNVVLNPFTSSFTCLYINCTLLQLVYNNHNSEELGKLKTNNNTHCNTVLLQCLLFYVIYLLCLIAKENINFIL